MKLRYIIPLVLVGCAPTTDASIDGDLTEPANTSGLEERLPDTCKLDRYAGFVGQLQSDVAIPTGSDTRIVKPGTILTQEYVANRVNFYVNEDGIITRVICG
ncbi:I78 family peptidase inhibitor [uncultured Litoreibacter sp.]|uniref:I78 family peptidase inhibitor n=1 Tax=uncultured Litoreibacter sp. TaxID=1392394 RepID=UPI0026077371|nr:I78 family peptidase inhibitor [uncultured Litoreibacter sp.]